MDGLVVVDKPAGRTSHDVVEAARRLFHTKQVGHTGTLDPMATGVLVLCLNQATRLAEYLSASRKNYVTEVVFGVETDTQDATGTVLAERDASHLSQTELRALLPRFQGTIEQIPPMVSARHHEGKRLYELARAGVTVERTPRPVQIERLDLLGFTPGTHPVAALEVTCSSGTYIRTLAADLGAAAGTGGMMRSLRRTWVGDPDGPFTLSRAHTLEEIRESAEAGTLAEVVLPLAEALSSWPQVKLSADEVARIRHGQFVRLADLPKESLRRWPPASAETPVAILDSEGTVCAVARVQAGQLRPMKVFTAS
ncbi:MAG TPA: tRNA pseudouridine(55) synthase TruB [Chthonomonadaceae bacterium]|nr:tRNA pseudouridine(55) synthase TruB [Chthonomonadaceae bacterium]